MVPTRVFVSSPSIGLEAERAAVKAALERMQGTAFSGMELFGSRGEDANTASLEEVDTAHLYVGIVGGRYGSGITRAEYDRACERGLDCLLYLQNEAAIAMRDTDPAAVKAREAWIAALTHPFKGHLVSHFSAPSELSTMVVADVHNWFFRKRVLEGIHDLPINYAARIENFFHEYVGTAEEPVPFGGRADVFAELDEWFEHDSAHPYLLIAAEAGRGKTATLVHWTRRRFSGPNVDVVFVPVSIRFRTNLAGVFFPALAARLARVHGDKVPTDVNLPAEVWRGTVADYLRKALPDGRSLVVVLDGLDEAADWEVGPDLFPSRAPAGLRIVVSGRLTSDLPDAGAWLEQLGWSSRSARTLPLRSLTLDGVRDVLTGMGFPLAELGENIVRELHRLSEGDPLLIRLYVDALWSRGEEAARLKPEDLAAIDPGLGGFFDRWWRDQKDLWGKVSPLKERDVRAVLNLLAVAFGPLRREDLLALAPPESELTTWTLDDALEPLRRFIVEGSSGMVFSHPRFGQYLLNELTAAERRAIDMRFADWSRAVRSAMREGALSSIDAPSYVVQYSGAHLERLGAKADQLCELLTPEWRTAWEGMEGGLAGFATDVARAWRAARRENEALVAADAAPRQLSSEVLCFLLMVRIRSLSQAIPPVMLGRLVEMKLWSPRQAAAYARNITESHQRAAALVEAARFAEPADRMTWIEEARATVERIKEPLARAEALVSLLRTGDPLDAFLQLGASATRGLWLTAAQALVESGRASEILRLHTPEFFLPVWQLTHWMIDHGAVDDAERTFRRYRQAIRWLNFEPLNWRFAIRGRDIFDPPDRSLAERVHDLFQRAAAGLPFSLETKDAPWIARILSNVAVHAEVEAFASHLLAAMDDDLREKLHTIADTPVIDALLGLTDPDEVLERLEQDFKAGEQRDHDQYKWFLRVAPLARGEIITRGVAFAAKAHYLDVHELQYVFRAFLRRDARTFRSAIDALSDVPLRVVIAAVNVDPASREHYLQRLAKSPTLLPSDAQLIQFMDAATLIGAVERFSRFDDSAWSETVRFVFDPHLEALPQLAARWQRSSEDSSEAALAAAVVPQLATDVLHAVIEQPPGGAAWVPVVDMMAELLSPHSAAEVRRHLWNRIGEDAGSFLHVITGMVRLPPSDFGPVSFDRGIPQVPDYEKLQMEVGRLVLLPSDERRAAVSSFERSHTIDELARYDLRLIVHELSEETIAGLAELLTDADESDTYLLLSVASRLTEAQARTTYARVMRLTEDRRSALPLLVEGLPEPERSQALRWMLSPEGIVHSAKDLVLCAFHSPELRRNLIEAVAQIDALMAAKALGNTDDFPLTLVAASRAMAMDAKTARKVALVVLDPAHIATKVADAWGITAALRPLLQRSGDEALFSVIRAAVESAVNIFP